MTARHVRAYIGLGANLGDPGETLASAVVASTALPGVRLRGVSRLYATAPVGVTDQPEFRNAAVALDVAAGLDPAARALALLVALKGIERAFGRSVGRRWGPRELDLDLLVFGRHRIALERPPGGLSLDLRRASRPEARLLVVPHPAARDRLFVLAPLLDLAPRLVPPGWGETVRSAAARRSKIEGPLAARPIATWDATTGSWRPLLARRRPPRGGGRR